MGKIFVRSSAGTSLTVLPSMEAIVATNSEAGISHGVVDLAAMPVVMSGEAAPDSAPELGPLTVEPAVDSANIAEVVLQHDASEVPVMITGCTVPAVEQPEPEVRAGMSLAEILRVKNPGARAVAAAHADFDRTDPLVKSIADSLRGKDLGDWGVRALTCLETPAPKFGRKTKGTDPRFMSDLFVAAWAEAAAAAFTASGQVKAAASTSASESDAATNTAAA